MEITSEHICVREINTSDIPHLLHYWYHSDPKYLMEMGADYNKLPSKEKFRSMLMEQIEAPIEVKKSYALIWVFENTPVGHCNVNKIEFGEKAFMHLHIWKSDLRLQGLGTQFVKKSLPFFFNKLELKELYSEPFAQNPAPNKTLNKIGFELVKEYVGIPGSINFEQEVKQWRLTKKQYQRICRDNS